MRIPVVLLCLLLVTVGCRGLPATPAREAAPVSPPAPLPASHSGEAKVCCRDLDEVEQLDGQRVTLTGRYLRLVVAKRGHMEPDLAQPGPAHVVVNDDVAIMLEVYYQAAGTRSVAEAQRFHGQRVVVTGTLHGMTPRRGDAATMLAPYLSAIERIELADEAAPHHPDREASPAQRL